MTIPRGRVARPIFDFDDFAGLFPGWTGRFEQLSRGRFQGTIRAARGKSVLAHEATTNQVLRVRGRERPGVMSMILVVPAVAGCTWQGRRLEAGRIVVRGGDAAADHQTSRGAVHTQLSFHEDQFRADAISETGTDPRPRGWEALAVAPGTFAQLESAIRRLLDGGGEAREWACRRAAVDALVPAGVGLGASLATRARLARRAEASLRDRLGAAITERELCTELGVPGRTLRLAFREQFGLGPMAFLQSIRLNAAHAALKRGGDEVSVAAVARSLGFQHLGKFASYYRRHFGELPSTTRSTYDPHHSFTHRKPTCDIPVSGEHPWRALGR